MNLEIQGIVVVSKVEKGGQLCEDPRLHQNDMHLSKHIAS